MGDQEDCAMSASDDLFQRARSLIPGGVNSPVRAFGAVGGTPIFFREGKGCRLVDVDGSEYIDLVGSWGPLILGSNHPELNDAIVQQLTRSYTFGAQHLAEIELAEKLVSVVPGVEQVIFSNTGNEAVQAALRISRTVSGRDKIVKFDGHYHGWSNNILVNRKSDQLLGMCGTINQLPENVPAAIPVRNIGQAFAVRSPNRMTVVAIKS